MNKDNVLRQLKTLLGIEDTSKDAILIIVIDECVDRVTNYCRRDDFPVGLVSLLPIMAHRAYISGGYGRADRSGHFRKARRQKREL